MYAEQPQSYVRFLPLPLVFEWIWLPGSGRKTNRWEQPWACSVLFLPRNGSTIRSESIRLRRNPVFLTGYGACYNRRLLSKFDEGSIFTDYSLDSWPILLTRLAWTERLIKIRALPAHTLNRSWTVTRHYAIRGNTVFASMLRLSIRPCRLVFAWFVRFMNSRHHGFRSSRFSQEDCRLLGSFFTRYTIRLPSWPCCVYGEALQVCWIPISLQS